MEPRNLNDRARYAYQFFVKRGYSSAAAAGIVGNLMVESGSFADDVIDGRRRGDKGTAFGIAQHRHERLANMEKFASQRGSRITDFETQLAFIDHEMRTSLDAGAGRAFKLLQDPGISPNRAAAVFMQHFERPHADPSINHIAKRQTHAMSLLGLTGQPDVQLPMVNSALAHANNPGDYTVNNQGTVPFNSVAPIQNTTSVDRFQEQKRADENAAGLLEGAQTAIKNNWSVLTPFRALGHFDPDPNFVMDDARIKRFGENVPNQYLKELEDAVSDQHAEAIRNRILTQLSDNQKLADMGWTGTALNVGAALTDPGAIAVAMALNAATKGIGGTAYMAARAGMATRIAIGAAEGAVANVATEIPLIAVDPTRDMSMNELNFAIGTGMVFGGAFGAMSKNPAMKDVAKRMEDVGNDLRSSTGITAPGSVGAATVGVKTGPSETVQDLLDAYKDIDPEGQFLGVRYDVMGQLLSSDNPMARGVAQYLGEDAVRSGGEKVTQIGATEVQQRLFRVAQANFTEGYAAAWDTYRKANGIGALRNHEQMREFGAKVFDYIREPNASIKDSADPAIKAAAAAFTKETNNFWKMAKDAGLTLSEDGVVNYVPRYTNQVRAMELIEQYGEDGITEFYKKAIIKAQPDIAEDLAEKMGNAVVKRMVSMQSGEAYMGMGRLDFDFDEIVEELGTFMSPSDIVNLKAIFDNAPKADAGATPRMKHRIKFDEQFSAPVRSVHGTVEEINISDFYIKDPITAFSLYSRNMSGQIALADIKIRSAPDFEGNVSMLVDGIKSRGDWDKLIQNVRKTGAASKANVEKDVENLNFLYSAITGTPLPGVNRGSDWNTFLRMLKDYNFIRVLNQVGFSQVPEFGRVTAQAGLTTMIQAVPSFRHFIDMVRGGRMTDDLAQEIRNGFAPGTDFTRSAFHVDADDFGTPVTQGANTRMQRVAGNVQPVLHKASRFTSTMSGMRHVNQLLQQWAARGSAVKFAKMAMFGDKVDWKRMRALGLDKADTEAILGEINKHARFEGGVRKPSNLNALGLDNWPTSVRVKYENAMFRMNRTMVLENDPAQLAKWMQSPLGSLVIQFRSFVFGSWTKATLQGMNMRDKAAAAGFLTSALIGTLVYAAQQHINLIGDPDRAEKLKERMSLMNLAAAGFSRTSESSLIPMLIDSPLYLATNGEKSLFSQTRSSGLKSDVFNFPAVDLVNSGMDALGGITSIPYGSPFSRKDFNALRRTLPFQNMLGVNNFFNWISSSLPAREPRN